MAELLALDSTTLTRMLSLVKKRVMRCSTGAGPSSAPGQSHPDRSREVAAVDAWLDPGTGGSAKGHRPRRVRPFGRTACRDGCPLGRLIFLVQIYVYTSISLETRVMAALAEHPAVKRFRERSPAGRETPQSPGAISTAKPCSMRNADAIAEAIIETFSGSADQAYRWWGKSGSVSVSARSAGRAARPSSPGREASRPSSCASPGLCAPSP